MLPTSSASTRRRDVAADLETGFNGNGNTWGRDVSYQDKEREVTKIKRGIERERESRKVQVKISNWEPRPLVPETVRCEGPTASG